MPAVSHLRAAEFLLRYLSDRGPRTMDQGSVTDWSDVADLAVKQELAPLLFKRLKERNARVLVPADAWERLRMGYFSSAKRNTRLFRELRTVLGCLRDAGIPVVVLKGAFLAEVVYGDVALRTMCDVDLMVPRTELPRAQAVLLDLGGIRVRPTGNELFWQEHHHPPPIVLRRFSIELHWTITEPTGPVTVDTAGLWNRVCPATVAGVQVLALAPEDQLLHLCLHFCRGNRLIGLRSFCDIAQTIRIYRSEMNWQQATDIAHEWHAAKYVGLALHLARSMSGAEVPEDVLERLIPGGLDDQVLGAARQAALGGGGFETWTPVSGLVGARSFGDMVKLFWERVFLPRDEMARVYPASRGSRHLFPFYLLRFWDAIRLHGASVLRLVRSPRYRQNKSKDAIVANWLRSEELVRQDEDKVKER